MLEGPLDLSEAGERVARVVARGKPDAIDLEEVPPIVPEPGVEAPTARLVLSRTEPGIVEGAVVAGVEQGQHGVLIQHQVRLARLHPLQQPRANLFGDWLQPALDAPVVLPRPRMLHPVAPDRLPL